MKVKIINREGGDAGIPGRSEGVGRGERSFVYCKPSPFPRFPVDIPAHLDLSSSSTSTLQLINSTTPLTGPRQLNPHPSVFSTTTVKPSLGTGFTYTSDVTLLLQKTGEVFDSDENEKRNGQGRSVVEVLKNRTGVRIASM